MEDTFYRKKEGLECVLHKCSERKGKVSSNLRGLDERMYLTETTVETIDTIMLKECK